MTATELDPWGMPLEPAPVVDKRAQQIGAASTIIWNLGGDDATLCDEIAGRILDELYPQVSTADEIEALPIGTILIGPGGNIRKKFLRANTRRVWGEPVLAPWKDGSWSSADLASNGQVWTVIYGGQA